MNKKTRHSASTLKIEILQNGFPVADLERPLDGSKLLSITADYKGDLSIPFYPIAADIPIFRIRKGKLYLVLEDVWSGYYTSLGEVIRIDSEMMSGDSQEITSGDFGSIYWKDLRVLFKVGPASKREEVQEIHDKRFQASISSTLFDNQYEKYGAAAALVATLLIVGALVMGLRMRPNERPSRFEELANEYTLRFLDGKHLTTSPEALQTNLDRKNYVGSIIRYYRAWTALITGVDGVDTSVLFDTTAKYYSDMHRQARREADKKENEQKKRDESNLARNGTALISIPAVSGSSLNRELLHLRRKIESLHESFEFTLNARRSFTAIFRKEPEVNQTNYKDPMSLDNKKEFLAEMSQSMTGTPRNEEQMYEKAQDLATIAKRQQRTLMVSRLELLSHDDSEEIIISPEIDWATFVANGRLYSESPKIDQIEGSVFSTVRKRPKREPLIGEINPNLMKRSVERKSFELQLCYELALRRNQQVAGGMKWKWKINTRGKVLDVSLLESNIRDRRMLTCVKKKISNWEFPRPRRGSIEVTHSFRFNPQRKG